MQKYPVSLQINIAPVDYPMITYILPNQLETVGQYCQEVMLTFDTKRVEGSRISIDEWNENQNLIESFIDDEIKSRFPNLNIKIDYMVYDTETRTEIGKYFFGKSKPVPLKDYRGGPYYSYYFGIYRATYDWVMHLDSDMLMVGNAKTWFDEAIHEMEEDATIFSSTTLLGPPAETDDIDNIKISHPKRYNPIEKYNMPYSFIYNDFSTRVFFFNRTKLKGLSKIEFPNFDHLLKALLKGNPPYRFPEGTISSMIKRKNWKVLSFKGKGEGLWALHPTRNSEIKKNIDLVFQAVEIGKFPESQIGHPDVQIELLDFVRELN